MQERTVLGPFLFFVLEAGKEFFIKGAVSVLRQSGN